MFSIVPTHMQVDFLEHSTPPGMRKSASAIVWYWYVGFSSGHMNQWISITSSVLLKPTAYTKPCIKNKRSYSLRLSKVCVPFSWTSMNSIQLLATIVTENCWKQSKQRLKCFFFLRLLIWLIASWFESMLDLRHFLSLDLRGLLVYGNFRW